MANLSLQGYFDIDVYHNDGSLKYSQHGIKNFITSTGLSYTTRYFIADCFRFVSLGSGTAQNTIQSTVNHGWGTTGLQIPLSGFQYIGSRTVFNDPSTSEYATTACGYRETTSGVILSRGWTIPPSGNFFSGNYTFNEVMLSPGRPANTDGSCGTAEGGNASGVDGSIVADYYDNLYDNSLGYPICDGTGAFTRIVTPISVSVNDFMVVTYNLNVSVNTGVHTFAVGISNRFPGSTNWTGTIIGYAGITNYGIKLINDGIHTNSRPQVLGSNYSWANEYGESFNPLWGYPLEPSMPTGVIFSYLSTDNTQFLVNDVDGGPVNTGSFKPWSPTGLPFSSGIMGYMAAPTLEVGSNLLNIRTTLGNALFANPSSFTTAGSSPSDLGWFGNSQFSLGSSASIGIGGPANRYRTGTYSCQFYNLAVINSGLYPPGDPSQPYHWRSFVLGYVDSMSSDVYPFYDIIFSDTNKTMITNSVNTGSQTYTPASNEYFMLDNSGQITFSFNQIVSSPCDPSVLGC